ncbi:MAG: carbon-nitrogen hydrolase family protein [Actinobacteria bacterium]|nr:carbon-nitrogen hydrolase family protein [Actinomycetota bacterium]
MKFKAGVVQMEYRPGDKDAALAKIEAFLDEAADFGAKLVCLQEYALTAYPEREWAEPIPGPSTERLGAKCRQRGLYLAAGSMVERDGDAIYNTVPLIGPDGGLVGKYRKLNLLNWPPKCEDDAGMSPGREVPVFDTEYGRIGLLCGADLDPSEPCRVLALKGCEVLLAPHSCTDRWVDAHRYIGKCRAWEDMFYLFAPNPCGRVQTPGGTFSYLGSSSVISPMGEVIANVGEFSEGVAVCTVDLDFVRSVKADNEWKFRNFPEAYEPLIHRLKGGA